MARVLLAIGVLVVTNLATFGYTTWRCRQQARGHERLLGEAQLRAQAVEAQSATLQQRLDRLQVWGELIELQQDVNAAHAAINRLNFGDALAVLERVQRRLDLGEYGELFKQHRGEIVPHLDLARQALRRADASAHGHLVDVNQRAFQILAAITSPGDFPGHPTAPQSQPGATTAPPPLGSPTPGPSPAPSPQPTPAGAATPASPTPSPTPA